MPHLDDLLAALAGGDSFSAEAASSELMQLGQVALPPLVALLAHLDAEQRWWAIRTLAQFPSVDAHLFLAMLADPVAEVRQAAALALAAHPLAEAAPLLARALSDGDQMLASLAVKALIAVGRPALPALVNALTGASQAARIHIIHTLAEIRDQRAIPVLMEALDSDSALVHHWANEGLERLGLNMVYIKLG